MSDEATLRARAQMASLLEPTVLDAVTDSGTDLTTHQLDRLVQYSQAVSLRRLADALAGSISLDETLRDFVNNLANTLAEHRMYSK